MVQQWGILAMYLPFKSITTEPRVFATNSSTVFLKCNIFLYQTYVSQLHTTRNDVMLDFMFDVTTTRNVMLVYTSSYVLFSVWIHFYFCIDICTTALLFIIFSSIFNHKTLSLSDSLISYQMLPNDFIRNSHYEIVPLSLSFSTKARQMSICCSNENRYCQFLCTITENQSFNNFINILYFIFSFSEWTAKSAKGSNADKVVFRPHGVTRLSAHFSIIFLIRYYPLGHMFYTNVSLFHKISHWVKRFLTRKHN